MNGARAANAGASQVRTEHLFVYARDDGREADFISLCRSAACAHLSREQISELIGITATLFDDRKRICQALERLPESFAEVRAVLNELTRIVR